MTGNVSKKPMTNNRDVTEMVSEIHEQLLFFKKDIDRRLDELSMEVNATSQLVGMAEETTKKHFTEMVEVLSAVSQKEDSKTPLNAGVELDTVVRITEQAATRILDAADRISGNLDNMGDKNKAEYKTTMEAINADLQEIFMACEFQDITSQRIRATLNNLQKVEDRLSSTLGRMGIDIEVNGKTANPADRISSQEEIDSFFE